VINKKGMTFNPRISKQIVVGQRLAYYKATADSNFWNEHWKDQISPETCKRAEEGKLGFFERPFTQYLLKSGRILEAGCGLGQYVLALRARGYDCEGVEWGEDTVLAIKALRPEAPIRVGDVTHLDVPNGFYKGYISLGVVEHQPEGPEKFLQEAHRVLSDDGVMLISVPHFHPLRKLKAKLGLYAKKVENLSFYQYAFSCREMRSILEKAGFTVIDTFTYDGYKGVKDEIAMIKKILQWRGIGWRLQNWLKSWDWAERNLGHMIMFVCRKAG
jgi:SAM-dependent methyltransferase